KHRMFDDVLRDRLNQRIVRDGLDEDGAVIVPGSRGDVYLERQEGIFLQQAVVNVLNGFEPGHVGIVDVMSFVVEDGEFFDVANDDAEVDLGVGGGSGGTFAEGVVAGVFVVGGGDGFIAGVNTVNVGEKDVARFVGDADVVLNVKSELEIGAPVVAVIAVVGKDGIVFQKDAQALKILVDTIEDDDVGGDDQEIAG